ncbi:hypothetical protein [Bradyrhizobium sp. JYMT SZCCT0428]|uniref:hypothetical protein n=1 Tax=Bradyrhizobium sp. JYMT SZCCT0428 TaxID=2807673 RepID=UPI001BA51FFB|nr:hypothetical protein [Bradyrhizobium sp. JYMT SZCCT0428]MBR1157318.1 hypothetical protein [Bradyrhizobium sp. JYMT SZCCT0428]
MLRILARISIGMTLIALFSAPAEATPNCLKDHQPYKLAGDTIGWSMTIVPGADCIQGLRWSTMQIYSVSVSEQPKSGELVLVGPGFRYFAKPDFAGTDSFTLVVVGKNRHDKGSSTVQITVSRQSNSFAVSSAGKYADKESSAAGLTR